MINQLIKLTFFLIPLLFILGAWFYYSFQKLKRLENEKLESLYAKINAEENIAMTLKNTPKETAFLMATTQNKLQNIKVAFFNINFSLNEIFN